MEHQADPDDRRRIVIELTPRGYAAADVVREAVQEVDAELAAALSEDQLEGLRAGLLALGAISGRRRAAPDGTPL